MARLGWLRQPYYTLNQMHLEILILGQQNKKPVLCVIVLKKNISAFWRLKSTNITNEVSFMRTIITVIFVFLFLVIGLPVLGIEWIISKFNKKVADLSTLRIVQWGFSMMLWSAGTKITYIGEENIPDGPVL